MSGGVSAGAIMTAVAAAAAGAVVSSALAPKPKSQAAQAAPQPEKPPTPTQGTQTPNTAVLRRQNVAGEGGPGGVNNTLLTGPAGVSNDMLNLGKSTLLGQ